MKKVLLLITVAIIGFGTVNAQEVKNVVKLNPLGALVGFATLGYEHAFTNHSSFVLEPTIGSYKTGNFKYSALGFAADYRYYTATSNKEAPKGFYLSPAIGYLGGK